MRARARLVPTIAEVAARDGFGMFGQLVERTGGHDLPPLFAGSRTEIDDIVRAVNRLFIVFDHDNAIALGA